MSLSCRCCFQKEQLWFFIVHRVEPWKFTSLHLKYLFGSLQDVEEDADDSGDELRSSGYGGSKSFTYFRPFCLRRLSWVVVGRSYLRTIKGYLVLQMLKQHKLLQYVQESEARFHDIR